MENPFEFEKINAQSFAERIKNISDHEYGDISEYTQLEVKKSEISAKIFELRLEQEKIKIEKEHLPEGDKEQEEELWNKIYTLQDEQQNLHDEWVRLSERQTDLYRNALEIERDRIASFSKEVRTIAKQFYIPVNTSSN